MQLTPATVPLYFECLSVPAEWRLAKYTGAQWRTVAELMKVANKPNSDLLEVRVKRQGKNYAETPVSFDPIEKRNEFFRLKEGDLQGLLQFLNSVGLYERAYQTWGSELSLPIDSVVVATDTAVPVRVEYIKHFSAKHIWKWRDLLQKSLEERSDVGSEADLTVRLRRVRGQPRIVLTTRTFLDSLFLTLAVDKITRTKVRKCARPDCGIVFTISSRHARKYCERRCAHIESVRRNRKRKKQQKLQQEGRWFHVGL